MPTAATDCSGSEPMTDPPCAPTWLEVEHVTTYRYAAPVDLAYLLAYLQPIDDERQHVARFDIDVVPPPSHQRSDTDALGNRRRCFNVTVPHREMRVCATSQVRVQCAADFDAAATQPWEQVRERLRYTAAAPYEPASRIRLRLAVRAAACPNCSIGRCHRSRPAGRWRWRRSS